MQICKAEVSLLGYRVERGQVSPHPEKLGAIVEFPEPQDMSGVRRFFGLVGSLGTLGCRQFIANYLHASPLDKTVAEERNLGMGAGTMGKLPPSHSGHRRHSLTETVMKNTCNMLCR